MALLERITSREWTEGRKRRVVLRYQLTGVSDDRTARDLIVNSTAESYDGLRRDSVAVSPQWVDTTRHTGLWQATVRYVPPEEAERPAGSVRVSIEGTGGTEHITQSIQTSHKYGVDLTTPPDFDGAIGVTGDRVEGVDITAAKFRFRVEVTYVPGGDYPPPDLQDVYELSDGKVNDAPVVFRDSVTGRTIALDAGECLLKGAAESGRPNGNLQVSYTFEASPNRDDITIGSMTGIQKGGWEYLWTLYKTVESENKTVRQPRAVYVEQVYRAADFGRLNIPAPDPWQL